VLESDVGGGARPSGYGELVCDERVGEWFIDIRVVCLFGLESARAAGI
jgi:hypothetical protein